MAKLQKTGKNRRTAMDTGQADVSGNKIAEKKHQERGKKQWHTPFKTCLHILMTQYMKN